MAQQLTPDIILAAISGFEAQRTAIDVRIKELRSMLNGGGTKSIAVQSDTGQPKRKKFSAASRRRMAESQKARWLKLKQSSEPTVAELAKPKKRKLSAAGRKAIS